jgi:hypothetical protein
MIQASSAPQGSLVACETKAMSYFSLVYPKQITGLPNNEVRYAAKMASTRSLCNATLLRSPGPELLKSATFLHSLTRIACNTHD